MQIMAYENEKLISKQKFTIFHWLLFMANLSPFREFYKLGNRST